MCREVIVYDGRKENLGLYKSDSDCCFERMSWNPTIWRGITLPNGKELSKKFNYRYKSIIQIQSSLFI